MGHVTRRMRIDRYTYWKSDRLKSPITDSRIMLKICRPTCIGRMNYLSICDTVKIKMVKGQDHKVT